MNAWRDETVVQLAECKIQGLVKDDSQHLMEVIDYNLNRSPWIIVSNTKNS